MGRMAQIEEMTETLNPQQKPLRLGATLNVETIWRIIAIIIGALFVYAGAMKIFDPIGFAGDIDNYKILPWAIGVRLAFYLPWLEIFADSRSSLAFCIAEDCRS